MPPISKTILEKDRTDIELPNIISGDTLSYRLVFVDSEKNPIDLTDNIISMTIKTSYSDADSVAILKHDYVIAGDISGQTLGIVTFEVPYTKTEGITAGRYYYDLQRLVPVDSPGITGSYTIIRGKVNVVDQVTKRVSSQYV